MQVVYVASLNNVKVGAVKEVLKDYEVIGVKSDSGVSNQPFSDEETIQGAINRCKNINKHCLRIGLEAGVMMMNDTMFLINYGAMLDENDHLYLAGGTRIPLPKEVSDKLMDRTLELSEVMEEYTNIKDVRSKNGAIGIFTCDQVKRIDIFTHIVKLLYGQYKYYNKE